MSHTPGPWTCDGELPGEGLCIRTPSDPQGFSKIVAITPGPSRYKIDQQTVDDALLIAAAPDLLALARRVHAECGPKEYTMGNGPGTYWICDSCYEEADTAKDVKHADNCLWLAADAVLTKAGVT